jgi:hypothetical protein
MLYKLAQVKFAILVSEKSQSAIFVARQHFLLLNAMAAGKYHCINDAGSDSSVRAVSNHCIEAKPPPREDNVRNQRRFCVPMSNLQASHATCRR